MLIKIRLLPDIAGAFCLILFVSLLAMAGEHTLCDADTLWHIKAGSTMLERHALLTHDIFSHTAYGQPWIAHEWLAEIIMAAVHQFAGLPGVAIFFSLLAALTIWLLFRLAAHSSEDWQAALCVAIASLLTLTHLLARPHIFTWLFGVITLFILLVRRDKLYLLPLLTAVWANLHGGFLFCLLLQAIFIAGYILDNRPQSLHFRDWQPLLRNCRKPLIILALSTLAAGLNPFGYDLFLFPFQVTKEIFINNIGEWAATNLREEWSFRFYLLTILLLLTFNHHRISWTNRLLLLFFINASFRHIRHVSLAGIFLTPFLIELLPPWTHLIKKRFNPRKGPAKQLPLSPHTGPVATLLLAALLLALAHTNPPPWQRIASSLFPLPAKFSAPAIQYLQEHSPQGKMFNEYSLGGYLIYAMNPRQQVFIDGRADMYGEKIFGDYGKIAQLDKKTDDLLREYEVDWLIFPADRPVILYLKAEGEWSEVYQDSQLSILVRKTPLVRHNSQAGHKAE